VTRHAIISGMGRSGTRWLATLLTSATPDGIWGRHEPHFTLDHEAILASLRGDSAHLNRYVQERADLCRQWAANKGAEVVVEVNSGLRRTARLLGQELGCPVAHLIRDPRDVINSLWPRNHYRDNIKEGYVVSIRPHYGHWAANWPDLTRFQKLCWLWVDAATHMDWVPFFRLEDLVHPAKDDLQTLIEGFIGIPYTPEIDEYKSTRVNPTPKAKEPEKLGPWDTWPDEDKEFLLRVCGPLMKKYGYEV